MVQIGVKTEKIWPNEDTDNFVNRWNLIFEFKINKISFLDLQEDCRYYFIKRQGLFRKTTGTTGSILKIRGALMQLSHAKGYGLIWGFGSEMDG